MATSWCRADMSRYDERKVFDGIFSKTFLICQQRTNDTYIELTRVYNRPVKKNFTCKQNWNSVGLSEVFIDEQMPPVDGFKCRTSDLSALMCSFKKPPSFFPIKYRLHFSTSNDEMVSSRVLEIFAHR